MKETTIPGYKIIIAILVSLIIAFPYGIALLVVWLIKGDTSYLSNAAANSKFGKWTRGER